MVKEKINVVEDLREVFIVCNYALDSYKKKTQQKQKFQKELTDKIEKNITWNYGDEQIPAFFIKNKGSIERKMDRPGYKITYKDGRFWHLEYVVGGLDVNEMKKHIINTKKMVNKTIKKYDVIDKCKICWGTDLLED